MKIVWVKNSEMPIPRQFINKFSVHLIRQLIKLKVKNRSMLGLGLTLVFLEPTAMKKINGKFRNKNKVTDVLSFESLDPESMGELLFCPALIAKNAKENGWAYRVELCYMLTHGVLHLLGYEHEASKSQATQMFAIQERAFSQSIG